MRLEALRERLRAAQAPDRSLDALIMLAVEGVNVPTNDRVVVLASNNTQPLCLVSDAPISNEIVARKLSDGMEVINFEFDGKWYHFVSRVVPSLTDDISTALAFFYRNIRREQAWTLSYDGVKNSVFKFQEDGWYTQVTASKNTIPAIAIIDATIIELIRIRDKAIDRASFRGPDGAE